MQNRMYFRKYTGQVTGPNGHWEQWSTARAAAQEVLFWSFR
jgi:hypothetical protein